MQDSFQCSIEESDQSKVYNLIFNYYFVLTNDLADDSSSSERCAHYDFRRNIRRDAILSGLNLQKI